MTGQINVNKIAARTGNTITINSGDKISGDAGSIIAPGSAIQIVKAEYTSSDTITVNSTSYVDACTVSFTPKFSNSIIKHTFFGNTLLNNTDYSKGMEHVFVRDSTLLCGGSWTSYLNRSDYTADYYQPLHRTFTDSPNTTSTITYKLQIKNYASEANKGWRLFDTNANAPGIGNGVLGNWVIEEFAQ